MVVFSSHMLSLLGTTLNTVYYKNFLAHHLHHTLHCKWPHLLQSGPAVVHKNVQLSHCQHSGSSEISTLITRHEPMRWVTMTSVWHITRAVQHVITDTSEGVRRLPQQWQHVCNVAADYLKSAKRQVFHSFSNDPCMFSQYFLFNFSQALSSLPDLFQQLAKPPCSMSYHRSPSFQYYRVHTVGIGGQRGCGRLKSRQIDGVEEEAGNPVEIGWRLPRIEVAGNVCLRSPGPNQDYRANDGDAVGMATATPRLCDRAMDSTTTTESENTQEKP